MFKSVFCNKGGVGEGHGANSQFGGTLPTAVPSGQSFASAVQATKDGEGDGEVAMEGKGDDEGEGGWEETQPAIRKPRKRKIIEILLMRNSLQPGIKLLKFNQNSRE